jgi:hypothetical protein
MSKKEVCQSKPRGKISRRSAGLPVDPVIEAYKRDIDRTLLRENLKLTVEERFLALMELQRFAIELRQAGKRARR